MSTEMVAFGFHHKFEGHPVAQTCGGSASHLTIGCIHGRRVVSLYSLVRHVQKTHARGEFGANVGKLPDDVEAPQINPKTSKVTRPQI